MRLLCSAWWAPSCIPYGWLPAFFSCASINDGHPSPSPVGRSARGIHLETADVAARRTHLHEELNTAPEASQSTNWIVDTGVETRLTFHGVVSLPRARGGRGRDCCDDSTKSIRKWTLCLAMRLFHELMKWIGRFHSTSAQIFIEDRHTFEYIRYHR